MSVPGSYQTENEMEAGACAAFMLAQLVARAGVQQSGVDQTRCIGSDCNFFRSKKQDRNACWCGLAGEPQ